MASERITAPNAGWLISVDQRTLALAIHLAKVDGERAQLFAEVKACNFFACGSSNTDSQPFTNPALTIENEEIVSIGGNPDTIEFIGSRGTVLHTVSGESTARYQPPATEPYVWVRARRNTGGAQCFSQAVWFVDSAG